MVSKGFKYLILFSLTLGLSIVINKAGLNAGLDPFSFVFSRGVIASIFCIIYLLISKTSLKTIKKKDWIYLIVLGVLASGIDPLLQFFGQSLTTATNTGFLLNLIPLFTLPFAFILLKEKPTIRFYISLIIMLSGSYLLSTKGQSLFFNIGDLLIILLTILNGFHTVFGKITLGRSSPKLVTNFRVIFGTIFIFIVAPIFQTKNLFGALIDGPVYVILGSVLFIFILLFLYKGMSKVTATETSLFFILSGIFPAILAYFFFDETLNLIQIIGALMILIGGLIIIR